MDINSTLQQEANNRRSTHSNPSVRRISGGGSPYIISGPGRPTSLPDSPNSPSMNGPYQTLSVIVNRDDNGYGMKVSGDNPVFVQSVKAGGAAEKAGLHAGDRIVEVNGENVLSSTHTEVVALIKSSTQVILKVQHKTNSSKTMGSPGVHGRPCSQNSQSRITGPQPVDNETQVQFQLGKEQHLKLMIEKEQRYVDSLRAQIATSPDIKKTLELAKAEKNLLKLYGMLHDSKVLQEPPVARDKPDNPPPLPSTPPPKQLPHNRNGNDIPPPLPKRNNRTLTLAADTHNNPSAPYANGEAVPARAEENGNDDDGCLNQCLTMQQQSIPMFTQSRSEHEHLAAAAAAAAAASSEGRDRCSSLGSRKSKSCKKSMSCGGGMIVDNKMYAGGGHPPPLPPRVPLPLNPGYEPDGANSINKQLSYPLVATCATLVNNCVPNHTHQRTKSSPESLINVTSSEASRRLNASESMNDLSRTDGYDRNATPPGTPPPPYPSPLPDRKSMSNRNSANTDDGDGSFEDIPMDVMSSPDVSPLRGAAFNSSVGRKYLNSSPIHAATTPSSQQSIISMEDDEISESDLSQFEDHGPFKSISQLWNKENMPYLAVFVNYVLSNCDPYSLLFYLITDLYKEGSNAKEMRKWAYEIHSCFLIPGAPLRIPNVDEPVVCEIDSALQGETTGEEMLRRIFWKARIKAKEELTKQLNEFQQKRVAGLGTIYGPKDAVLSEIVADKTGGKDVKHYESVLLERLNMNEDSETVISNDPKKYYTIAATITVVTRVFGVRLPSDGQLERWQTFVSKEKSLRTKIMGRYSRKLSYYGHQYDAKQYYTVIRCSNCTQIIYGIAPQGYICSACHINLHRNCISQYTDVCPGKVPGKGMKTKIMDKIRNEKDQKRKQSSHFILMEKERRMAEEKDNGIDLDNVGKMWSKQAESRSKHAAGNPCKTNSSKSQRKRKTEKKGEGATPATLTPNHASKKSAGKQASNKAAAKAGKQRAQHDAGVDVVDHKAPDLIEDIKVSCKHMDAAMDSEAPYDDGAPVEVVLRKKNDDAAPADPLKRYSDSIVNDNITNGIREADNKFVLSRAHSGFFLLNSTAKEPDTKEKKRRFSDLFRHSLMKSSSDDSESKMAEFGINENGQVTVLDDKEKKANKKAVKRADTKLQKPKANKPTETKPLSETTPNSVLRRVRSRIYKTKTENSVSIVPSMPDIREQKEKKSKKSTLKDGTAVPEEKKAFEFRLLRQSSNLEFIRPRAFITPKKPPIGDMIVPPDEKPILSKSKSSSAINLSLLRTRRKLLDVRKHASNTKSVEDEFDFMAFENNYKNNNVSMLKTFGSQDFINTLNNNVANAYIHNLNRRTSCMPSVSITESKPGNPVTRTPSDRRPDAFREESRDPDVQGQGDVEADPFRSSVVSLPASTTGNKQRQNNHINRSESVKEHSEKNRKQKRNISDPLRSGEVLAFNDSTGTFQERSGSSSNSSISSKSTEGFSNEDSDLDVEPDPPDWKGGLTEEQLSGLHAKEKARQDVINELFHTERTHVRNLKVIDQVFRKHIADTKVITEPEQNLVFANLPEVLAIHNQFNAAMKKKRAEHPVVPDIGDLLVSLFDGDLGNKFCSAVARFCEKQQLALELISERRKKDSKLESVLATCEKNNLCRRLQLQGLLPQEMQRTTKYKLLVERLIEIQESLMRLNADLSATELDNLKTTLTKVKSILNTANEAAAAAQNQYRLDEIRNHLDLPSDIRANDWVLIREGNVMLKRQNKNVPVHMLLLNDSVIILHKDGDRYVWKPFHVNNNLQAPIIRLSGLICRPNAADMTCLFLLSNASAQQPSQMYEIQCPDETERKTWFKYLADASEPFKSKDGKNKRNERNHDAGEDPPQELSAPKPEALEQTEPISESDLAASSGSSTRNSAALEDDGVDKAATPEGEASTPVHAAGEGSTVGPNDWPLIEPSEVQVAETSVHTAEPILTPLEKIKRKDEEVKKALADKEVLVADLLSIPRESYRDIADMVGEKKTDMDPCELVLASLNQVNKLLSAVNDSMNITDADAVAATGGKHPACNSNELPAKQNHVPSVPASKIQSIATTLQSQLTNLLNSVKQKDEESEKMRKEVHRLREQLHENCNLHTPQANHHDSEESVHHESQSGDLESIEESPIETETT